MKTSTEIGSISKIVGYHKAVELCGKAGFDAWDFSMFDMCRLDKTTRQPLPVTNELNGPHYLKFARELKNIGLNFGMVCNQSHAPFPVNIPAVRDYLKRAIECTAEAGGAICVIHPDNFKSAEENAEMFLELLPYAKQYGVKIAAENMWSWSEEKKCVIPAACSSPKSFNDHLDAVNDEFFVACLDIGHAEMKGVDTNAPEMIKALGNRLQALHIHDNNHYNDSHQIPFSMEIDFVPVADALREINYSGYLTLEAVNYPSTFNKDNVFDAVCDMQKAAKRLSDMIEK
jgi:sugar phosphate isomerase/epimerase